MKRLTRNHSIFAMDKQNQPALYVDSGERFIVETEDCFSHQIVESDDVLRKKIGTDTYFYYRLCKDAKRDKGIGYLFLQF